MISSSKFSKLELLRRVLFMGNGKSVPVSIVGEADAVVVNAVVAGVGVVFVEMDAGGNIGRSIGRSTLICHNNNT
jgi:hypothetical protein